MCFVERSIGHLPYEKEVLWAWPGRDLPPLRIPCSGPQGDGPRRGVLPAKPKRKIFYVEFLISVTVQLRDPHDGCLTKAHVSNLKFGM